jgi:polysaccharide pyruvyl transferase WcaK-like protein
MINVEIKGIGFPNRGAELMLLAIIAQFEKRDINVNFVVEPMGDFKSRSKYPLFYKSRFSARGWNFGVIFQALPKVLRERYGIINSDEIDIILDASGFAYGDKWGLSLLKHRFLKELVHYSGKPIILLPQAFGPFNDPKLRTGFLKLSANIDLLYSRDKQSKAYLKDLGVDDVVDAPDFTNLVTIEKVSVPSHLANRIAVIPNFQMESSNSNYVEVLARFISCLRERGENPFLLVHEGVRDRDLASRISNQGGSPIEIIDPQDALVIKAIISKQKFIITSRFHGAVSALSTGVIPFVMGWSHKYEELLADYGVPSLMCDVDSKKLILLIDNIINVPTERQRIKSSIVHKGRVEKLRSIAMWDNVFKFLKPYLNV